MLFREESKLFLEQRRREKLELNKAKQRLKESKQSYLND